MKALIAYYSRTGTTKKIAEEISQKTGADIIEIIDKKTRSGPVGFIISGKDAMMEKTTDIAEITIDLSAYDLLILGTPVWAGKMSPAIRTYIESQKEKIRDWAIFTSMGGSGGEKTIDGVKALIGKAPKTSMTFIMKNYLNGGCDKQITDFIRETGV